MPLMWVVWWAVVAATGICTLAGFAGRFGWPVELAAHFRLHYALILAVALIPTLFCSTPIPTMVAGSLLLINLATILPLARKPRVHSTTNRPTLRLLHVNVLVSNLHHAAVERLIKDQQPDVVLLQEINPRWMDALRGLRSAYPHGTAVVLSNEYGLALLSRMPLETVEAVQVIHGGLPSIVARLSLGGRRVTLIGTHPHAPTTRLKTRLRDRHLLALADRVRQLTGPVIVFGDFNTTSWSWIFRRLVRDGRLRDSRQGFGIQPTWPTAWWPLLRVPIDHCLVSRDVLVLNRLVGPAVGSDHLPIVIECSLERAADGQG